MQLKDVSSKFNESEENNNNLREKVLKLEEAISQNNALSSSLRAELESSRAKVHENELKISSFETEKNKANSEFESLLKEKSLLQSCIDSAILKMNELRTEVSNNVCCERIGVDEVKDLPLDHNLSLESYPEHVQSLLSGLKHLTSAITSQLNSLQLDHQQTMARLAESEQKCSALTGELGKSEESYALLVQRCTSAQSSSDQNTAKLAALELENAGLVSQLDRLKAENSEQKSSLLQMNEQLTIANSSRDAAQSISEQLKFEVEKHKTSFNEIREKLTATEDALSESSNEKQQLQVKLDDRHSELEKHKDMLKDKSEVKLKLENELQCLQNNLESFRGVATAEAESLR